jgi:hypothetical protein
VDGNDDIYTANFTSASVVEFKAGAKGNQEPLREINGTKTTLDKPSGVALDAKGVLYVSNNGSSTIVSFAAGAHGNASPATTIAGSKTTLNEPLGISIAP